jgi:hypothetical protein
MSKQMRPLRARVRLRGPTLFATAVLHLTAAPRLVAADTSPLRSAESRGEDGRPSNPRASRALLTGMLLAGGSLGAGGWLVAGSDDLPRVHAGLAIGGAGLALAPLFAHGVAGEWERGAWFSLPPALAGAGMLALVRAVPEAPVRGRRKNHTAVLFPLLVGVDVVASAIGITDAALADQRRDTALRLTAHTSPDFNGLQLGGTW